MPILNLPAINPSSARLVLAGNTQSFTSPLDGSTQTLRLPGATWRLSLVYDRLIGARLADMEAFVAEMEGQSGRCYAHHPHRRFPRGPALGVPVVDGAGQAGSVLLTRGWQANLAGILLRGDLVAFDTASGRELKRVIADANSDSAGKASLQIRPALRKPPADGVAIVTEDASCIMRLADDQQGGVDITPPGRGAFRLDLVESFTG